MKTWIDWMSRIAGGMLFQGGYVTSPTMLVVAQPAQAAGGSHREPDVPSCSRERMGAAALEERLATAGASSSRTHC